MEWQNLSTDYEIPCGVNSVVAPSELAEQEWEEERASWARFSLQMLSYAYGDDEPEYTTDRLIEENPEYEEKRQ
ncbi:glycosyl hydrolase family 31 [Candidatus Poribacteria bacterium]|nr:MAG: glycosyl hydrolase family 31 [Candidatus Poribacteria bacterium]